MSTSAIGGALIERGRVRDVSAKGVRVESLTRPGVISPPLNDTTHCMCTGACQYCPREELRPGDMVYYFMFADGGGCVIGKI